MRMENGCGGGGPQPFSFGGMAVVLQTANLRNA